MIQHQLCQLIFHYINTWISQFEVIISRNVGAELRSGPKRSVSDGTTTIPAMDGTGRNDRHGNVTVQSVGRASVVAGPE